MIATFAGMQHIVFGHHIVTYSHMLGIENQTSGCARCNIIARTWPNDYSIMQHLQMLYGEFESTTPNISQHVATHRNGVAKCAQPQQCCDTLRSNVATIWPGLYVMKRGSSSCRLTSGMAKNFLPIAPQGIMK